MEEIRILKEKEMKYSHELINFAFKQPLDHIQPLIQSDPEDVLGCFVDGELASNVVILPQKAWIQNMEYKMGLICGVASWPEYRKHGTITRLMQQSLKMMRSNKQLISILGPFSVPFYTKYGWGMMYDYKRYKLKAKAVPTWQGKGYIKRESADHALLNPIYETYAQQFNGMFVRDEARWQQSIFEKKKGMIAVYYTEHHEPRGYMIYQYVNNELQVHEMVYLDQDSYHGLWDLIKKQDSMYEYVSLKAPSTDPLHLLLDNPKGLEVQLKTHFMARIVDIEPFFEKYHFQSIPHDLKLYLRVEDSYADWNNGTFSLTIDASGNPSMCRVNEQQIDEKSCISCNIQTLSSMMVGYKSPIFLQQHGQLRGDADTIQQWNQIIPQKTTFCLDLGY